MTCQDTHLKSNLISELAKQQSRPGRIQTGYLFLSLPAAIKFILCLLEAACTHLLSSALNCDLQTPIVDSVRTDVLENYDLHCQKKRE